MLLEMLGVSHAYQRHAKQVLAVDSVDLRVDSGEFVAIQGPSGSGKTTLLMIAGTLLHPNSGIVTIADQRPYEMSADERARFRANHIGFVFQMFHLVPYLSVLDNVLAPALASGETNLKARAEQLIEQFGLSDRAEHVPAQLSSGERQRCALARALLKNPKLVLADEPTGNLDEHNATVVMESLRDAARNGTAVILVTHDQRAAEYADRQVRMQQGIASEAEAPAAT